VSGTNRSMAVPNRRSQEAKIFLRHPSNLGKSLYFNVLGRRFEVVGTGPL